LTTEVLGTHFNINTYADESARKVTLLEGSVRVRDTRGGQVTLKPGQQARVNGGEPDIRVEDKVDIEAVMAWKNDYFMMKGTDIGALARQMARWYDVQVVFGGEIPDRKFGGSISRNVNLSTMLEVLHESGINSRLEGKKVIIL
jgi:ferric-dicitrate binding protein FerR (iron transport regulator)